MIFYLLHSANRQDYIEAAKSYYKFLRRYNNSTYNVTGGFATYSRYQLPNGTYQYTPSVDSWIGSGLNASSLGNENITIIPSAANNTSDVCFHAMCRFSVSTPLHVTALRLT